MGRALLEESDIVLIRKTQRLLEELLETLDITSDEKAVKEIKESRLEAKRGRTKPFRGLLKELDLEKEV